MKIKVLTVLALFTANLTYGQASNEDKKFSPPELKADLIYLKNQLFQVHAYPYSELSKADYNQLFSSLEKSLTDSLTAIDFFKLVKPVIAPLSDEHAGIYLPKQLAAFKDEKMFFPFTLIKQGNFFLVDSVFIKTSKLLKGDRIVAIDNIPIAEIVKKCANYTSGFPNQRPEKATKALGYLYPLAYSGKNEINIKKNKNTIVRVECVTAKKWIDYLTATSGSDNNCNKKITYSKINETGYINACSFDIKNDYDFKVIENDITKIFEQIEKDKISKLIIDISKNSGGNSAVGDLLISSFYGKPYRKYQCNWKRSDEYVKLYKSWGLEDKEYEALKPGEVLHYDADVVLPKPKNNRFTGKVYILIGEGTFSSAMLFATIIKDNGIATLIGETPKNGHPTHFGESYSTTLPNTKLGVNFGVKEWIRPAGKNSENVLRPDIPIELNKMKSIENIIAHLPK